MKTANDILQTFHPIVHDEDLKTDLWDDITIISAMEEYAKECMPKWISVETELPKYGRNVLVFTKSKTCIVCYLDEDSGWIVSSVRASNDPVFFITHWQPLPLSPTE